ncbi:TIR domain-containing protein [Thalassospira mesophila]|uniref:Nuclease n=1 Tax=Thalassospira mesophila TaxID=1293891 RepID=A0A1Y2KXV9_9PROT|nr:TIR domain-containing protein [Thalassospira mesophila]OSQ37212.1 nuclease [Thalassospira mesophila]
MPALTKYQLFISHSWKYSERYTSMISLLDTASNFNYTNYSVPEDKAFDKMAKAELKKELTQQISPAQAIIIIGGMYINHSEWLQYEINEAIRMGKPILGVRPRGAKTMPLAVQSAATEVVNWSTASIVAGIRKIAL